MNEQLDIYAFIPWSDSLKGHEAEWLRAQGFKNWYEEHPPKPGVYEWADIECPAKTRRLEVSENGGIVIGKLDFNPTWWKPVKPYITDDYIRENPTCFYVFGHYLDREAGWHKVPDQLPTFTEWTLIDVVVFGKKTSTAWMEHEKWEAKDWTFRSVDQRRDTETTEILAWKKSEDKTWNEQ